VMLLNECSELIVASPRVHRLHALRSHTAHSTLL
jgi:hypothetical protein